MNKILLHTFQVKQNHIVKIIFYKMKKKNKLKPKYENLKFLDFDGVFKLETVKLMMKLHTNKLPDIITKKVGKVASVQRYSTSRSSSNDYFVPSSYHMFKRTSHYTNNWFGKM